MTELGPEPLSLVAAVADDPGAPVHVAAFGHRAGERITAADVSAGVVTALFSVPEGMAYAAIGGFAPSAGLYAGIAPALTGSLLARTTLIITSLTSAIALTSHTVLLRAHLSPADPANVAALSLLVAVAMAVFAALRLDAVLRRISAAAMTGFCAGIAVQIVAGALHEATGYRAGHRNELMRIIAGAAHAPDWSVRASVVAGATMAVWALAHAARRTRQLAMLLALVSVSAGVCVLKVDVALARSLGALSSRLPILTVPAWGAAPRLVMGAGLVALVALAQAAAIPATVPSPDGDHRPGRGSDILAQAAANAAGAFCQAPPVGGSLSRSAVAHAAGARTRWAGVVCAVVLALFAASLGALAGRIPLPVIGALTILIGAKLLHARIPEVRAAWRLGPGETAVIALTFLATTQFPLPYALMLGLGLSLARDPALLVQLRRRRGPVT